MGRGSIALIGLLFILTLGLILVIAVLIVATGAAPGDAQQPLEFGEAFWLAMVRTLDAGTFGADTGWRYRLLMLVDTLGGVFVVALLIGVLSNAIEIRLDELRKGRSPVVEQGHTLILGWSPKIFTILNELAVANESERRACIVVVADRDKVEMDDDIRERVVNRGSTRIICRRGNPVDPAEIQIGGPLMAKSIIVLSPENDDPDSEVMKTLLALTRRIDNQPKRSPLRIVAEIRDERNRDVIRMIAKDEVRLVLLGDVIARIAAQTCRQSGLSAVLTELLSFQGNEFYFHGDPALAGKTFREAQRMYETSVACGILTAAGDLRMNPPEGTRFETGDRALVLAEDDRRIALSEPAGVADPSAFRAASPRVSRPERTLILGWNKRGHRLINELDTYLAPNSVVHVVTENVKAAEIVARLCANMTNLSATVRSGDTTDRRALDALDIPEYDHIIVLCDETLTVQRADARAMVTLMHLRDIAEKTGANYSITAEMLDIRDRDLAAVTRPDDFVVSDELTSLMVAQLSETGELEAVFDELFTVEGCEVYLKPVTDYVGEGIPVTFHTLAEAANLRGEVAVGFRLAVHANDASRAYGVVVNPRKNEPVSFSMRDRLIVIARD